MANRKRQTLRPLIIKIILDIIIFVLAYGLSILTFYDLNALPPYIINLLYLLPGIILIHILGFYFSGVYRILTAFFGFEDVMRMIITLVTINVFFFLLAMVSDRLHWNFADARVFVAITFYETILLLVPRVYRRMKRNMMRLIKKDDKDNICVLVLGAGFVGEKVAKEVSKDVDNNRKIIGFLDDNPAKIKNKIIGITVLGPISDLEKIINNRKVDEIIIAIKNFPTHRTRAVFDMAAKHNIKTKRFSGIEEVDGEHIVVTDIKIDDLLNRGVIKLENENIASFIEDEVVLVTGGGGSIGGELCRQIAELNPKQLIIFDIYENNAYDIQQELLRKAKKEKRDLSLVVLIGSVYNYGRLEEVFKTYKPTIVFHAAAYKHVPLMEDSPKEALRTNVIGTYNASKLANIFKAKKFILVSSDKAVRSTNVMGATKRFAELVIQEQQLNSQFTKYSAVRFGNVLGSNGSVIPLFSKQIADGGPVTVTDREITRFFMTIPEAVGLILQAAVFADGGEIFVLDMGEPVKITDLAEKMIRLSGLRPHIDIKIVFTGLRPGEKLYEELLVDINSENHVRTRNDLIFVEKQSEVPSNSLGIDHIKKVFESFDNAETITFLASIVKTYTPKPGA